MGRKSAPVSDSYSSLEYFAHQYITRKTQSSVYSIVIRAAIMIIFIIDDESGDYFLN